MFKNAIDCICIIYGISYTLKEYHKSSSISKSDDKIEKIVSIIGIFVMSSLLLFTTFGFNIAKICILIFAIFVPDMNNLYKTVKTMKENTHNLRFH